MLGAKIAQVRGKWPERTKGYSNDDDALRAKCGIALEPEVSESARGSHAGLADALGGLFESALSGELADTQKQIGESDPEDLGDCVITTV